MMYTFESNPDFGNKKNDFRGSKIETKGSFSEGTSIGEEAL